MKRLIEVVAVAVVGLLIILLVVRPIISKIFEVTPGAIARASAGTVTDPQLLAAGGGGVGVAKLEAPVDENGMPIDPNAISDGGEGDVEGGSKMQVQRQAPKSIINMDNVEGNLNDSSVRQIGEIIDKHPEEAVAVIRNWMYQGKN